MFVLFRSSLYVAREAPSHKFEASSWLPPQVGPDRPAPCWGRGETCFTCFSSLSTVEPPFPSPTHQATVSLQVWGWGGVEQERFHLPGAVTDPSGGLPGRVLCTKLPLPLMGIFIGSFETSLLPTHCWAFSPVIVLSNCHFISGH